MNINGRLDFADTSFTIVKFSGRVDSDICAQLEDAECETKNRKQCVDSAACKLDGDNNCVAIVPLFLLPSRNKLRMLSPCSRSSPRTLLLVMMLP